MCCSRLNYINALMMMYDGSDGMTDMVQFMMMGKVLFSMMTVIRGYDIFFLYISNIFSLMHTPLWPPTIMCKKK